MMTRCAICGAQAVIAPVPLVNTTMAGTLLYPRDVVLSSLISEPYCAEHNPIRLSIYTIPNREEIERILTIHAALLAVVAQVVVSNDEHGDGARCHFCGWTPAVSGSHAPECLREQARTLLSTNGEE